MLDPNNLPCRIMTSEVLELARFGSSKLRQKQKLGEFPNPIDRGKQSIYDRDQVLAALGLIEPVEGSAHHDPFRKGLERLGKAGK